MTTFIDTATSLMKRPDIMAPVISGLVAGAAFKSFNLWFAIPIAAGATVISAGTFLDKRRVARSLFNGVVVGMVGIAVSLCSFTVLHPMQIPSDDEIKTAANSVCWSPDKTLTVTAGGKEYIGKLNIVQTNDISYSGELPSYKAVVTMTREEPNPFFGVHQQRKVEVTSATRPGTWKPGMAEEQIGPNNFAHCNAG